MILVTSHFGRWNQCSGIFWYVVSLHFYNIVFIYLSQHSSHRESWEYLASARRLLHCSVAPAVLTWRPAVCFLMLLWDCTHCCQYSLFKQHTLLRSVYKIQLIVLWVIPVQTLMLQIVVSHMTILFVIFGSHASKCVSLFALVKNLRLVFLCRWDTVLHSFSNAN